MDQVKGSELYANGKFVRNSVIGSLDYALPATNGRFSCCDADAGFARFRFCACERWPWSTSGMGSNSTFAAG